MKKAILLSLIALATVAIIAPQAKAQVALTPATDTLTNTDTARLKIQVKGSMNVLTFQANYTKISGTSASSLLLQGSLDGVNFVTIKGADTATVANVAGVQAFTWVQPRSNFLWYRIYGVTSGTQSGQLKAWALYRE